jgi:hypothetical protein
MNAKEFYEYQLNDKTSVVGRQDKDEIIMLMEEYHKYAVKNCSIPAVVGRSEQLCYIRGCKHKGTTWVNEVTLLCDKHKQ